jgi:hypothetical protein
LLREETRHFDLVHALKESWWVFLFISFIFSGFLYATSSQKKLAIEISEKIELLQHQHSTALDEKGYLEQKLQSRDDPDFITMTLVRVLGLTPKGQQKVIFDRLEL